MKDNNFIKQNLKYIISSGILVIVFLLSLILFLTGKNGKRRVFIFPSATEGKYIVETRYLANNPLKDDINFYVDEILLGSGKERTKRLFTPGTKVLSCFEREGTLYLDLSPDLLKMGLNVVQIQDGMNLLEMNIKKAFPKIKTVRIFVDGKYAYDYIQ